MRRARFRGPSSALQRFGGRMTPWLSFFAALAGAFWWAGRTLRRLGASDPFDVWLEDDAAPPSRAELSYMDRTEPLMD